MKPKGVNFDQKFFRKGRTVTQNGSFFTLNKKLISSTETYRTRRKVFLHGNPQKTKNSVEFSGHKVL